MKQCTGVEHEAPRDLWTCAVQRDPDKSGLNAGLIRCHVSRWNLGVAVRAAMLACRPPPGDDKWNESKANRNIEICMLPILTLIFSCGTKQGFSIL